jgi:hypothetical protein
MKKEGSSSFLKKRTKKLLLVSASVRCQSAGKMPRLTGKSFLVLFFKKEHFLFL